MTDQQTSRTNIIEALPPLDVEALLFAVQATNDVLESRTASMAEKRDRLARAYRRFAAEPRSDAVIAPDPEADNAPCGCGAIGVAAHTNVEHYAVTAPDEPHRDYAGRTCTTGLMHAHAAPDEPSTEAGKAMIRDCTVWGIDPSLAAERVVRIEQQARAASASVPPFGASKANPFTKKIDVVADTPEQGK